MPVPPTPRRRSANPLRRPPPEGRCPLYRLPDELWLEVLAYFDWRELLRLRWVSRRVAALALSPSLYQSVTIMLDNEHLPRILTQHIVPSARHISIFDNPWRFDRIRTRCCPDQVQGIMAVLAAIPPDSLQSLSIQCAHGCWDEIGPEIARIGERLERLDLRGAKITSEKWYEWMAGVGTKGWGLRELDLSVSTIPTLPPSLPFQNLRILSLRSCLHLRAPDIDRFLANLPPNLESLNLSYLPTISMDALRSIRVTRPTPDGPQRTPLHTVHLVGIDHLTRADVRALQRHWAQLRATCGPPEGRYLWSLPKVEWCPRQPQITVTILPAPTDDAPCTPDRRVYTPRPLSPAYVPYDIGHWSIMDAETEKKALFPFTPKDSMCVVPEPSDNVRIFHSALLESDDEAGYRRFIEEVVAGTLGADWGELSDPEADSGESLAGSSDIWL